jgi:hypothetical protein
VTLHEDGPSRADVASVRFPARPHGDHAELVDVLAATPEETAAALPASWAWWLIQQDVLSSRFDDPDLARMLGESGLEITFAAPEAWRVALEHAVRTRRLLVILARHEVPRVEAAQHPPRLEPPLEFGLHLLPRG